MTAHQLYKQFEDSALVIGPSRSGKSRHIALPMIASAIGPTIATGTKVETVTETLWYRRKLGQCWTFDPLKMLNPRLDVRPIKWSPVHGCEDPEVALRRARAWSGSQATGNLKDGDWWARRAGSVIAKHLHAAALIGADILTVKRWGQDLRDNQPQAILREAGPPGWADQLSQLAKSQAGQAVDSIVLTIEACLECLDSPAMAHVLTPKAGEHFNVDTFFEKPNTVYLLAPDDAGDQVAPVFTMLMDELHFVASMRSQRFEGGFHWPPVRIVGDELPQLAPVRKLDGKLADSGGRGIEWFVMPQTFAQLQDKWGDKAAEAMIGTAALRLYLPGIRERVITNDLNRLVGKRKVRQMSYSRQERGGLSSDTHSVQASSHDEEALPDSEVRGIDVGQAWMEYRNLPIGRINLPDPLPHKDPPMRPQSEAEETAAAEQAPTPPRTAPQEERPAAVAPAAPRAAHVRTAPRAWSARLQQASDTGQTGQAQRWDVPAEATNGKATNGKAEPPAAATPAEPGGAHPGGTAPSNTGRVRAHRWDAALDTES